MQKFVTRVVVGAAFAGLCSGPALGVTQSAPVGALTVKDPPSGNRLVFYKSKPAAPLVGDPIVSGATLNFQLTPGGSQCFHFPPGAAWRPIGTPMNVRGYRYRGLPSGTSVIIRDAGTRLLIKVKVRGPGITVVPGNPTLTYGVNFDVKGTGDEYCASTGTTTPTRNTATIFRVRNDNNGACTLAPCSPSGAFLEVSPNLF